MAASRILRVVRHLVFALDTIGFPLTGRKSAAPLGFGSNYTVSTLDANSVQISNFTQQEKTGTANATDMKPFHEANH